MAYVAMNQLVNNMKKLIMFLNGVCRHELRYFAAIQPHIFLNGVCRHELYGDQLGRFFIFLNGVCRHELLTV